MKEKQNLIGCSRFDTLNQYPKLFFFLFFWKKIWILKSFHHKREKWLSRANARESFCFIKEEEEEEEARDDDDQKRDFGGKWWKERRF